jgi:hypothetical protein
MAATNKGTKPATKPATETGKPKVRAAYRVEFAAEVAALRVVGAYARIVGNAELLEAHRALTKQTYRPAGSVVRWAKPEHRTMHGNGTPDNGTTVAAFATYVAGLLGDAPGKGEPGHDEHRAAVAALAAFGKVAA